MMERAHDALFERGRQLMSMGRADEAVTTFRRLIVDSPQHGPAHAMLALCYIQQEEFDLAIVEAHRAISFAPDVPFVYYVQGVAFSCKEEYRKGLAAIDHAIAREPESPLFHTFRARVLMSMNRPEEARAACQVALQFDPEDSDTLSLLAILESQGGNCAAAEQAARAAVQANPNDAHSYIALGYQCTFADRPGEAFEAFREALRLEPNSTQAREGLVLALQTHHFLYRRMFAFFAWMARLAPKMQWAVILGLVFFQNIVKGLAKISPTLGIIFWPVLGLCLAFCLLTWVINPLSYAVLLFSRWGRLALSPKDKATGILFALMFLTGLGVTIWGAALSTNLVLCIGLSLLALTLPVSQTLDAHNPTTRTTAGIFSVLMFLVIIAMTLWQRPSMIGLNVLLFIAFQFIFNVVAIRSQKAIE